MKVTLPLLHNNGTSKDYLFNGYKELYSMAKALYDKLNHTDLLNRRDYYPLEAEAWIKARKQHEKLVQDAEKVMDTLFCITLGIADGGATTDEYAKEIQPWRKS
jgi:hypothetical protein